MTTAILGEKHILVAEDEFLLADDLCRDLEGTGAVVVGPVPSVKHALALIASAPAIDAAVLDANLGGEMAFLVADALLAKSVPFIFTSGYDDAVLKQRYPQVPRCQKPTHFSSVAQALAAALADKTLASMATTGAAHNLPLRVQSYTNGHVTPTSTTASGSVRRMRGWDPQD